MMEPRYERVTARLRTRTLSVKTLVARPIADLDLAAPPGPLTERMLPLAHAALERWEPPPDDDDATRGRLRRTRERRRGEHDPSMVARKRARTSELDVERLLEAERVARDVARTRGHVSIADVRRWHALTIGSEKPEPLRRSPVWIADATGGPDPNVLQPVAAHRVKPLLDDLDRFLARDDVDPVFAAALVYPQLLIIHPWADGNGRASRLLTQTVLAAGLPYDGRAPDAIGALVDGLDDGFVIRDIWIANGMLDEWLACFCGAVVQSVGTKRPESVVETHSKRRLGRPWFR